MATEELRINLIIGTHHKTGTVWMRDILKDIARGCGFHFVRYPRSLKNWEEAQRKAVSQKGALLRIDEKSHIRPVDRTSATVMHLVRDPRDVLVSATHYHQKSTENFLMRPWGRKTHDKSYKDYIKALETFEDKARFEMSAYTSRVFADMQSWDPEIGHSIEVKYEDLIQDKSLSLFRHVFDTAGFDTQETLTALEIVWDRSLFGGMADQARQKQVVREGTAHIRNGHSGQWINCFTYQLACEFRDLYQPLLEKLGYEANGAWVDHLR